MSVYDVVEWLLSHSYDILVTIVIVVVLLALIGQIWGLYRDRYNKPPD
jgi:uncharacterized membrane protein YqjE